MNKNSDSSLYPGLSSCDSLRGLVIFVVCLILSSCGFHLRGTTSSNIHSSEGLSVFVGFSSDDRFFERQLKNDLKLANVTLVKDATQVNHHLIIVNSFMEKKSIGIDSVGRNNEFEISYAIDFVINNNGKQVMQDSSASRSESKNVVPATKTIVARRSLYIDRSDPIGKRTEEKKLLESMRQELSNKLVRQFISVTNYSLGSKALDSGE